jgi:hypothetical protein
MRVANTITIWDRTRNEDGVTLPLIHTVLRTRGIDLPRGINLGQSIGGPVSAAIWATIVGRERYEGIETAVCADINDANQATIERVHRSMLEHEDRNGEFPSETQRNLLTASWTTVNGLIRWLNERADEGRGDGGPGGGGGGGGDGGGGGGGGGEEEEDDCEEEAREREEGNGSEERYGAYEDESTSEANENATRMELTQNISSWLAQRDNGSDASQLIVPILNAALMRGGADLRQGVNATVTNGGSRINEAWTSILEGDAYERLIRLLQNWVELEQGQPYSNIIGTAVRRLCRTMQDDGSVEPAEQTLLLQNIRATGIRSNHLHCQINEEIEAVLRRASHLAQATTTEQIPAGTTKQILRTWLAISTNETTYSLIYCPLLHEAMRSEHSMEHRRVWPLILGEQYNILVEMYRAAFASLGSAARRRCDTTNPHIDDDEQERLLDLPAGGEMTSEVERMIREWQASPAADAARAVGRVAWRRTHVGGHECVFTRAAPNRTTWVQIANGTPEQPPCVGLWHFHNPIILGSNSHNPIILGSKSHNPITLASKSWRKSTPYKWIIQASSHPPHTFS